MQISSTNFNKSTYKKIIKECDKNNLLLSVDGKINNEQQIILDLINTKDLATRYFNIYDLAFAYLSRDLKEKNYCQFEDGKCIANRKGISVHSENGCCWQKGVGLCKHLDKEKCKCESISCKLYICSYLRLKGIKYNPKKIFPLKYFFNTKQIKILKESLFKSKKEVIDLLINL